MSEAYQHIYPVTDLIGHDTDSENCYCRPSVDRDDLLIIHNAIDNREFDEIEKQINGENYEN